MRHCACGHSQEQPWQQRDTPISPASFLAGLFLLGLSAAAAVSPMVPHAVGWGLLALFGVATILALVWSILRGHRHPACLAARGLWLGVAWPGLPVRVVLSLPF